MTINYTWNVTSMQVADDPRPATVVSVRGYLYGEGSDGHNNTEAFAVELPPPGDGFTPYDQLTQPQVQAWIEALLPDEIKARYKDAVAAKIERCRNPQAALPSAPPVPWGVSHTVIYQGDDA